MKNSITCLIISVGMIISAIILGCSFYNAQKTESTVRVVGYATEDFNTDMVKWKVVLNQHATLGKLEQGQSDIHKKLESFQKLWNKTGIKSSDINIVPSEIQSEYGRDGVTGYIISQQITILSKDIDKIEKLALNPTIFLKEGISFQKSNLNFFSTKTDELKKALLSKASVNARQRAEEIVADTDMKINKLISAKAGVFQITEPYSTDVSSYGIYNTNSKHKTIKVTVSSIFCLK